MALHLDSLDAYAPDQIARRVEQVGVRKARGDTVTLAVLAGAFISLGAAFFTVVVSGSTLGFGVTRLLGGLAFCLGLVLVVIAGHTLVDRFVAVLFPITAFVALGFEHSIANWFFLPYALVLSGGAGDLATGAALNLFVVSIGNVLGGTVLVAGVYWLAYLRMPSE